MLFFPSEVGKELDPKRPRSNESINLSHAKLLVSSVGNLVVCKFSNTPRSIMQPDFQTLSRKFLPISDENLVFIFQCEDIDMEEIVLRYCFATFDEEEVFL
jgi:hypothetical protein